MRTETIIPASVEARLSSLERSVRFHRLLAVSSLCAVLITIASGQNGPPAPDRAIGFEVVDGNGNLAAALGVDDNGLPGLWFYGVEGHPQGFQVAGTDGKVVYVRGAKAGGNIQVVGDTIRGQ